MSAIFGDLTEEMRGSEAAEGRSGTLRGLQVAHTASEVAVQIGEVPQSACALEEPDAGLKYVIELEIEREARDEAPLIWRETRTFLRDTRGDMRLEMEATYTDELGNAGEHTPVQMIVDGRGYEGPDPQHVYRRDAGPAERRALIATGRGTFQALLNAAPGWTRNDSDNTWSLGGEPLICGVVDPSSEGWLRRLATRGSVVDATMEAAPDGRRLNIRWLLEDGVVMQVHAEDQIVALDGDVKPPSESHVIEVRRDRSWKRVNGLLDRLERDGAIERAPSDSDAGTD